MGDDDDGGGWWWKRVREGGTWLYIQIYMGLEVSFWHLKGYLVLSNHLDVLFCSIFHVTGSSQSRIVISAMEGVIVAASLL